LRLGYVACLCCVWFGEILEYQWDFLLLSRQPRFTGNSRIGFMREIVEKLLELQELEIVVAESRILHKKETQEGVADVTARIEALREAVPDAILRRYDAMRRNGLAVSVEQKGVCSGCRLNIPLGDLNRMRRGVIEWCCPNCARFLLLSKETA
jgi:predicted  nucleic acid-binding Zn-ribbon protein